MTQRTSQQAPAEQALSEYLSSIRKVRKMTLREVEEASGGDVSNAYLSQLENHRISKPSPNVLHVLSSVYAVPYELLMQKAGYLSPSKEASESGADDGTPHGRVATFADEHLTQAEEEELLDYLAFLRSRGGKRGKTR